MSRGSKNETKRISNAVIKRLPRYKRYLEELQKKGVEKISSEEFANLLGYTPSQIRQDLNNFGGFGQQGYGYKVETLNSEIGSILGLDREYKMLIVGAGNLGQAIANYTNYYKTGFIVDAIFETDEEKIGKTINDREIVDYKELVPYVEENAIDIGIICVPKTVAQEVADKLCFAGVKGIWNFSPIDLEIPPSVSIQNVHLSDVLHTLAYDISKKK